MKQILSLLVIILISVPSFSYANKMNKQEKKDFANYVFEKIQKNNRTRYIALCDYLKSEYDITVKDVIPEENKPFSKIYNRNKVTFL